MLAPTMELPGRKKEGIDDFVSLETQFVCSVTSTTPPRPTPCRNPRVGWSTENAPNIEAMSNMGSTIAVARYLPVVQ